MAQAKKTGSKKGKSSAGSVRAKKAAPSSGQGGGSNRAFYILVIIILLTVIVLLVNRYAEKSMFRFPVLETAFTSGHRKPEIKKDIPDRTKNFTVEKDELPAGDDKKNPPDTEPPQDTEIKIYLLKLNERSEKIYLSQVRRRVRGEKILETSLESLIRGPSASEQERGYITAVPATLKIRRVRIIGRTAEIDFSGAIEDGASGDILLKRIQQIVYTATQFDNVDSVIIIINGKRRKTLGSDGFSISGPLRR